MKKSIRSYLAFPALALAATLGLAGCAGMTQQEKGLPQALLLVESLGMFCVAASRVQALVQQLAVSSATK